MKNLKVYVKLYGLSTLLLLALVVTATTSLVLLRKMNDATTIVSENWLPSVILAEELNTATSDFRIVEASHVISQDEETMLDHESSLLLLADNISDMFYHYAENLVTNQNDHALLEKAQELWTEYLAVHQNMISHSRENDTESAMFIMENESEDLFNEVSNVFLELVQFNKNGADLATANSNSIYENTTVVMYSFTTISILFGILSSSFIIASVVKPVSEIKSAASEILKGDLSTEILYSSKDELGSLSNSMRDLCRMVQEMIADLSRLLEGMSEGDFSVKSEKPELYVGDFAPLLHLTQDISEKLSKAIFQLHHKDALTGFSNRAGYTIEIEKVLEDSPNSMGVISVNVNGLKHTNENSGISAGDALIKTSANYLNKNLFYQFFRMSGDEFVGIAPNAEQEDFEKTIEAFHTTMHENENYDFSLGHTWGGKNFNLWKLMQEADTVMYINKQEYYAVSQRSSDSVDNTILAELLSYLENDEFMVYLQPQVHLSDGSLHGAEALIRRFDKTNQKMVFPDQFISLYEQKSVIRHVDLFVVEAVCQLLQTWNKVDKAVPISVNLSRVTLLEFGIVDAITKICDKYQVPHHLLVIEVTERVGLIENNVASSLITSFKENGFHISLDDFGCAYSNIVTLAQIEVDEVKIDKSLVDEVTHSKKNQILVKNVLAMCNELENTSTLAEGIEDQGQAKLLHQLGCQLGQGYFYSRPIPVADFEEKYIKS